MQSLKSPDGENHAGKSVHRLHLLDWIFRSNNEIPAESRPNYQQFRPVRHKMEEKLHGPNGKNFREKIKQYVHNKIR